MITIDELQSYMRQFGGPLEDCKVTAYATVPQIAVLKGKCMLNGQPHFYECEFDRVGINGPEDVIAVVHTLLKNMNEAASVKGKT